MPTLTVRNLDPDTTSALRALSAKNGRSMEAEVRVIIAEAVHGRRDDDAMGLGSRIRARFAGIEWDAGIRSDDPPRAADFDA